MNLMLMHTKMIFYFHTVLILCMYYNIKFNFTILNYLTKVYSSAMISHKHSRYLF